MANTVNFSGLTDYINENRDMLFVKSVSGAKTLDYVDLHPNVVNGERLHYLDSSVVLGDGSTCSPEAQGEDTFSERELKVIPIQVFKKFCAKAFREKWMNYQYNWEAGRIELPLNEAIAQSNIAAVQEAVENLVWKGDGDLGFNGFLDIASSETATTKVQFASGATATEKIDAMVAALSVKALKRGVDIFISFTDYRNYVQEQNSTCCSNKPVLNAADETITYFGDSRIRIIPVLGLEGTGAMLASPKFGLAYGTDIIGSEGTYKWVVDEITDNWYLKVDFTAGVQIAEPDMVVYGANA